jgi:iron complex transport system permease protein
MLDALLGNGQQIQSEILLNYRLPKAVTAILAGAALSVAGLLMQTLFRNPLADPYILGVSSGSSLGVALITLSAGFLPAVFAQNSAAIILAAVIGGASVLAIVLGVSFRIKNTISLLIVGIMLGTMAASLVSVMQNFSNPDALKLFIMWTLGSLSAVSWDNLQILIPLITFGLMLVFLIHKRLDAMQLGENYARALGVSIPQTRFIIVLLTGLLAGSITAYTGPIAFVGVAIPHLARGIFKTSHHKILIPVSCLCGAILILFCDIVSQLPAYSIPINTLSSLLGAPVILWIILRKQK